MIFLEFKFMDNFLFMFCFNDFVNNFDVEILIFVVFFEIMYICFIFNCEFVGLINIFMKSRMYFFF